MSKSRLIGFSGALVVAALVGGTIISAVSAAPSGPGDTASAMPAAAASPPSAEGTYCAAFRAAFAAELGITEADLAAAGKAAVVSTIDRAVADGKLKQAAADRLKARLAASPLDACQKLAKRLDRVKPALGVARGAMVAAAGSLGLTPKELRTQLRDGGSLKTIATSKGVAYEAVTSAVLAAVKADLDAAVEAGTIAQARADTVLKRLGERLATGQLRRTD